MAAFAQALIRGMNGAPADPACWLHPKTRHQCAAIFLCPVRGGPPFCRAGDTLFARRIARPGARQARSRAATSIPSACRDLQQGRPDRGGRRGRAAVRTRPVSSPSRRTPRAAAPTDRARGAGGDRSVPAGTSAGLGRVLPTCESDQAAWRQAIVFRVPAECPVSRTGRAFPRDLRCAEPAGLHGEFTSRCEWRAWCRGNGGAPLLPPGHAWPHLPGGASTAP